MTTPNRVALVTGANKGIGLETARQLAQQDVYVLLGARDAGRGGEAAARLRDEGLDVEFVRVDNDDPATHKAVAEYIGSKFGRLDILVNNAGVQVESGDWAVANASTIPMDALRQTFETNFFGVVALTQALLPLIRKSEAGRIVNLSSILGSLTLHATPGSPIYQTKILAYNASKTALNAFTVHLAYELKDTPIKVNSAHPGWVQTDMGGAAAPMSVADGAKTSVQLSLLPADGPTGGYFHMGKSLPW